MGERNIQVWQTLRRAYLDLFFETGDTNSAPCQRLARVIIAAGYGYWFHYLIREINTAEKEAIGFLIEKDGGLLPY